MTVCPGRSSPIIAPLPDNLHIVNTSKMETNNFQNVKKESTTKTTTDVIKMQRSPNTVFPKIWLEGYNWHPSPSFAEDPTVQNGPIETP